MNYRYKFDRSFLIIIILLVIFGFFIFSSASLGLLARGDASFGRIVLKQFIAGIIGIALFYFAYKINYKFWKKYSLYFFLGSLVLTALVFIPAFGFEHGGARRWLSIGPVSFQPAELLKFSFVVYFAAWLSQTRSMIRRFRDGIIPMSLMLALVGALLLAQPNTGVLVIILAAAFAMFIVAGGRMSHLGIFILIALLGLSILSITRPYIRDRLITFINPKAVDKLGPGYQIDQSLIAIASGKLFGKGLGQGVQKFNYLPEPVGDSIFAVAAEEFGFMGATVIISLFVLFAIFGFRIAARAPDSFSRLLVTGIVILVVAQSFINIGAMLNIFPLSGIPILFISQGGSALAIVLLEMGVILNISKYRYLK